MFTLPPFAKTINASEMGAKLAGKPHLKSASTVAYETTALKWILKCCPRQPRSLVRVELHCRCTMTLKFQFIIFHNLHYYVRTANLASARLASL
ncbi:hypothetical protein V6N13_025513 [Hibiscus sabdariffa]